MSKKNVTNVLFIRDNKVLLGLKKRGFGRGKYNGFGGKPKEGETVVETAIREAREETGLVMNEYYKAAEIDFGSSYPFTMHLYVCTAWEGKESESEEMIPAWFSFCDVPYSEMWDDDKYWLHLALSGKKFKAQFDFENDDDIDGTRENKVTNYRLHLVDHLV